MPLWESDEDLFNVVRQELFVAVVGDVMDTMGLLHQFLPPQIEPLQDDMVVIGRAMPVAEADITQPDASSDGESTAPFGLMFRALDDLKPGEIYVASGGSPRYAFWGELMSLRAMKLGAVGAVVNGYSRDTLGIRRLAFPTFSYGGYAQDQRPRGKVVDFRVSLEIEKVRIDPGDIVFGDRDGVCIVPHEAEEEAFRRALEKIRGERLVQAGLEQGLSAQEVFATYGIM